MEIENTTDRQRKTMEIKDQVFAIVEKLLDAYGFESITVRTICKEASLSSGSFYHHFDSKENLLFLYGKKRFEDLLQKNPLPAKFQKGDYVMEIAWVCSVYAKFCEQMGPECIKFLVQNCPLDIFYETCFEERIIQVLNRGLADGYLRMDTQLLYVDIDILYKGIIYYWSNSEENRKKLAGQPDVMQRVLYKFLYSFSTEKYRSIFFDKTPAS